MKFTISLLTLFFYFSFAINAQDRTGKEIIIDYIDAISVDDLTAELEVKIISKNGRTRVRSVTQNIQASDACHNCYNTLLRFVAPSDVKNTSVLSLEYEDTDDDQWLFLPALKKSRRISANNKKDRFMGTEITYEDISNELSLPIEEYNYISHGIKEKDGRQCYLIEAIPTDEEEIRTSGYSKRMSWIDIEANVDIYSEFFDKEGNLLKIISREDIRKVGDTDYYRAYTTYVNNVQTGNRTELFSSNIKINKGLDNDVFTKRNLEKVY